MTFIIDSVVDQVTLLSSNNSLWHSEQYLLYIRSLCSLPTTVRPQSACFAYCLFQFILIYLNLFWIYLNSVEFLSEKRGHVKSWTMCQRHHSHMWRRIHTRFLFFFFSFLLLLRWSVGIITWLVTESQKVWQKSQNGHVTMKS